MGARLLLGQIKTKRGWTFHANCTVFCMLYERLTMAYTSRSQASLGNAPGSEAVLRKAGVSSCRQRFADPQSPPAMRSETSLRNCVPKLSLGTSRHELRSPRSIKMPRPFCPHDTDDQDSPDDHCSPIPGYLGSSEKGLKA